MNQKMLSAVVVALVLCLALSTTALAAPQISCDGTVAPGQQITVTISSGGRAFSGRLATSGLEFVSQVGGFCTPTQVVLVADADGMSATYTYTVTAESGEEASVRVFDCIEVDEQGEETGVNGATWSQPVVGGDPTQDPSERPSTGPSPSIQPPDEPTGEPTQAPPQSASPMPTGTTSASVAPSRAPSAKPSILRPTAATSVRGAAAHTSRLDRVPRTADAAQDLWLLAAVAAASASVSIAAARRALGR